MWSRCTGWGQRARATARATAREREFILLLRLPLSCLSRRHAVSVSALGLWRGRLERMCGSRSRVRSDCGMPCEGTPANSVWATEKSKKRKEKKETGKKSKKQKKKKKEKEKKSKRKKDEEKKNNNEPPPECPQVRSRRAQKKAENNQQQQRRTPSKPPGGHRTQPSSFSLVRPFISRADGGVATLPHTQRVSGGGWWSLTDIARVRRCVSSIGCLLPSMSGIISSLQGGRVVAAPGPSSDGGWRERILEPKTDAVASQPVQQNRKTETNQKQSPFQRKGGTCTSAERERGTRRRRVFSARLGPAGPASYVHSRDCAWAIFSLPLSSLSS